MFIPQYSVSKPSKAHVDAELLWYKPCPWWCRRKVPSATMSHDRNFWPVSDRRAERDRWGGRWEVQAGGGISNSHKIISLWIISVSKLKSLATDGHFETECCFWVTVLFFACSSPCPLTRVPPPPHSLAQLPPGQPSCGIIGVIFRFANSATKVPSFWRRSMVKLAQKLW